MIQLNTGSQILKIDNQGRIKLPTSNADYFKTRGNLMMSLDPFTQCLVIMPLASWEEKANKILQLSSAYPEFNAIKRRFVGNARECSIDSSARLAIPGLLRQTIEIEHACVFVSQGNKFEIFSESKWLEINQKEINLTNIPTEELKKYEPNLNI